MNAPIDWVSTIAILAAGLLLGAIVYYVFGKRKAAASLDADLERKDLEAKRDALVAELRALPDDAIDERARLEQETANVLRKLDLQTPRPASRGEGGRRPGEGSTPVPATPVASMNPAVKGFLWGAGSFAALAALGFFVYKSLEPRADAQQPQAMQQGQQQPDLALQQLQTAVQNDPNNLQLRNDLAQAYFEREDLMNVFEQTQFVLGKDPNNSRALTFAALVRVAMGETEAAMSMLQQATKSDPKNLDSWVAIAWMHAQSNKMTEAEAAIAEAVKVAPHEKARLEDVLRQMKSHGQTAQATQELPPDHPPLSPSPGESVPKAAEGSPSPAEGKNVRVTLQLDAAAASKSGIVYVMARPPAGGPPVAVKRLMVQSFPITVDFGAADSMMGQPLPNVFKLEARLDSDGDAATKPPTDPKAQQENVTPGATVTLALK